MRLQVVGRGHRWRERLILRLLGLMSRDPVSDILRALYYRPEFFGRAFAKCVHVAMRGPSEWSVGERELMAAFVSAQNRCPF